MYTVEYWSVTVGQKLSDRGSCKRRRSINQEGVYCLESAWHSWAPPPWGKNRTRLLIRWPACVVLLQPWMVCWKKRRCCVHVNWSAASSSCPRWPPPTVRSASAAAAYWSSPTSWSQVRTRPGVRKCSPRGSDPVFVAFFLKCSHGSVRRAADWDPRRCESITFTVHFQNLVFLILLEKCA